MSDPIPFPTKLKVDTCDHDWSGQEDIADRDGKDGGWEVTISRGVNAVAEGPMVDGNTDKNRN
jgi:hypothetical protein